MFLLLVQIAIAQPIHSNVDEQCFPRSASKGRGVGYSYVATLVAMNEARETESSSELRICTVATQTIASNVTH